MAEPYLIDPIWVPHTDAGNKISDLEPEGGFWLKIIIEEKHGSLYYRFLTSDFKTKRWIEKSFDQNRAWSGYDPDISAKRFFYFNYEAQTLYRCRVSESNIVNYDFFELKNGRIMPSIIPAKIVEEQKLKEKISPHFLKRIPNPSYPFEEILEQHSSKKPKQDLYELICQKTLSETLLGEDHSYRPLSVFQRAIIYPVIVDDWLRLRDETADDEEYSAALRHILKGAQEEAVLFQCHYGVQSYILAMRSHMNLKFAGKLGEQFYKDNPLKGKDIYCFLVCCIMDELTQLGALNIEWIKPMDVRYENDLASIKVINDAESLNPSEQYFLECLREDREVRELNKQLLDEPYGAPLEFCGLHKKIFMHEHGLFMLQKAHIYADKRRKLEPMTDGFMVKIMNDLLAILYEEPIVQNVGDSLERTNKHNEITFTAMQIFCEAVEFCFICPRVLNHIIGIDMFVALYSTFSYPSISETREAFFWYIFSDINDKIYTEIREEMSALILVPEKIAVLSLLEPDEEDIENVLKKLNALVENFIDSALSSKRNDSDRLWEFIDDFDENLHLMMMKLMTHNPPSEALVNQLAHDYDRHLNKFQFIIKNIPPCSDRLLIIYFLVEKIEALHKIITDKRALQNNNTTQEFWQKGEINNSYSLAEEISTGEALESQLIELLGNEDVCIEALSETLKGLVELCISPLYPKQNKHSAPSILAFPPQLKQFGDDLVQEARERFDKRISIVERNVV